MATLSLCMIVKNEEDVILRCLHSCSELFDEIIVVDTGSTDKTIELLKNEKVKLYHFDWINDFSAARNFAFSLSTSNYNMWLDADDIIEPQELHKLKILKNNLSNYDVIMLKYLVGTESKNPLSFYRERIVKNNAGFVWEDAIHEVITPKGEIYYSDIYVTHKKLKVADPKRNIKIYEHQLKNGVTFRPRQMFYYARELYYNDKFKKAITWFNKFLKTKNGYKENYIEACLNVAYCYENLKNYDKAKLSLFNSFMFDTPRSEILCEIGNVFYVLKDYNTAIYYYNLALNNKPNFLSGAFINIDAYEFTPLIQLCVCHYWNNNKELSKLYFEKAKLLKPDSPIIAFNQQFF